MSSDKHWLENEKPNSDYTLISKLENEKPNPPLEIDYKHIAELEEDLSCPPFSKEDVTVIAVAALVFLVLGFFVYGSLFLLVRTIWNYIR